MTKPGFGPAGAGELFYSKKYKNSYEVPFFLSELGLTAFEYQCGRGVVKMGKDKAELLNANARKYGITLSIHAPYFISLAVSEEEKREKNIRYFLESAALAKDIGASRIVFHPGGVGKMVREEAIALAKETLSGVLAKLDENGYGDIIFCPETMGKINQLGDLTETIEFCKLHENMIPCVDFGHMNSRLQGQVNSLESYEEIFLKIENELGAEKAKNLHCHFSKIQYGKSGEIRHLTFEDTEFGPDYEPLMELLYQKGYTPTIICESAGTQAEDALIMQKEYERRLQSNLRS